MSDPTAAMPIPEPGDGGGSGNGGGSGDGTSGGTVLGGRYRLENVAGRGGMAEVWRAHDTVLDRVVAVKWFTPGAGDVAAPARQQAEMKLLAGFNHPGLVTVFDAGVQPTPMGDRPYVVMEFVDGPTLAARLARGPMAATAITAIGSSVASALAYVHERGVVHRDIKPGNILLEGGDDAGPTTVKLADFGIARLVDDARVTKTGMTVGTASYLSPEQVRGETITPKSDIYSLALVLLEAFTGTVEFPGSPVEAAVARLNRDPVIPGSVGPVWGPLLASMTARDPALRPTAREVADQLVGSPGATSPSTATTSFIPAAGFGEATGATAYIPPTGGVPRPIVASMPPSEPPPPVRPMTDDDGYGAAERPPRPLWPWIVAVLLLIIVGAVVAFALANTNGGDGGSDPTSTPTTPSVPTSASTTAPSTTAASSPSETPTTEQPTTPQTTATVTESVTPTTSAPPSTSTPPTTSAPPSTSTPPSSSTPPPSSPGNLGDGGTATTSTSPPTQ